MLSASDAITNVLGGVANETPRQADSSRLGNMNSFVSDQLETADTSPRALDRPPCGAREEYPLAQGQARMLRMSSSSTCFKVAFIGTHGVGKTTLCYGLAARLKKRDVSLEVVHEVARRCPLPINEETSVASQSWILHTQIAEELTAQARYPMVICDRSALDNYVYLLIAAGPQRTLDTLVERWMSSYDLLFHVPIVAAPSADGVRATDPVFQRAVDDRLLAELSERELPHVNLDPLRRDGWLRQAEQEVLTHLQPPQLRLPEIDSENFGESVQ
jgi:nicotinamide riboside kinase